MCPCYGWGLLSLQWFLSLPKVTEFVSSRVRTWSWVDNGSLWSLSLLCFLCHEEWSQEGQNKGTSYLVTQSQGESYWSRGCTESPWSWLPVRPTAVLCLISLPLQLRSGCGSEAEPSSSPSLFANLLSCKQILPCGIVAVIGKKFIYFQFCSVGRLLKGLSVFSSHINFPPATAPNSFCS